MSVDFHTLSEQFERVYSRRLALRPAALCDAWPLYAATQNSIFNQGLLWSQPSHEQAVLDRMDAIVSASRRGRMTALSAIVKSSGEWVSLYRFQPYAADPSILEMGIWTHDRFWHGQYSLELVRACIDAAFDNCDVDVLLGASAPSNRSSCKLMEWSGMKAAQLVYRRHESGSEVQLQEFQITRDQWARARAKIRYQQVKFARDLIGRANDPAAAQPEALSTAVEARPLAAVAAG